LTAIDHGFVNDRPSGMLDWLTSFRRNMARSDAPAGEPRMIAAEPLLLDTPAPPGFRSIQQEAVADEGPRPLSMGAMAAPLKPISLRRDSIYSAFSTAMPVTDRHGLAGRNNELEKLVEAIVVQRKHAVIFGTRGSGKTSLARVFGDLADEAGCVALYGSASGDADFDSLFRPFLSELPMSAAGQEKARKLMNEPLDVTRLAALLVEDVRQRSILILDEYDRVRSDEAKSDVATHCGSVQMSPSRSRQIIWRLHRPSPCDASLKQPSSNTYDSCGPFRVSGACVQQGGFARQVAAIRAARRRGAAGRVGAGSARRSG